MLKRQNELLRALQKELAATEQELADQKWVFEHFLSSPSWRMTAPARWVVHQLRVIYSAVTGRPLRVPTPPRYARTHATSIMEHLAVIARSFEAHSKAAFTGVCRSALDSFLATGSRLELTQSATPSISIILVLFNRAELSFACLRSISEHREDNIEVIIVDNASSDDTASLLDRIDGATILRNTENINFLQAVNLGARSVRGQYILILNNDAQLLPGTLTNALNTLRSSPNIGAVGGKIILLDGTLQEAGSIVWRDGSCLGYGRGDDPLAPSYMFRRDVDYCSGAFLMTPRLVWEQLKGFDEAFLPAYYEETDYCMRLQELGLRVVYEPAAAIVHYEFGSSDSSSQAMTLQREHQHIFASRHQRRLQEQRVAHIENTIFARDRHHGRRVLFLEDRVPHSWLGSGFPRARALLLSFLSCDAFVTLFPLDGSHETWDEVYSDIPREVEIMSGLGRQMLESFLRNRAEYYDAIIISRPHNMAIFRPILKTHPEWFEDVRVFYDAEALFSARTAGLRELLGNPMTLEEREAELKVEIGLASLADCVITVSESERKTFLAGGIGSVRVVGHALQTDPGEALFAQRHGLLFVGAIYDDVSPNADSMFWFIREILPLIRNRIGDVTLTLAGINQSERIRRLEDSGIRILGHVRDLGAIYNAARVFIAPTRYAAGIPHKIHESAARGLPVVTTPLMADQLGWTGRELGIGSTAESFADNCIAVYTNHELWSGLRNSALEHIRTECSQEYFERSVREILQTPKKVHKPQPKRLANAGMDR